MPRARCHWAMLLRTRDALRQSAPDTYRLIAAHLDEYLAGGMAPDALRLFAGADKPSSHFYDDQRQETWEQVVETIRAAHPAVADPATLDEPARVWMLGYLAHIMTDIAYWRHVISRLPPFPQEVGLHFGAWVLADQAPLPPGERTLDLDRLRFTDAPPWVREPEMRRMLERVVGHFLVPDERWAAEVAYHRHRADLAGMSDADILATRLPEWEANVAAARALLPPPVWDDFYADAVRLSVAAIRAYLNGV